MLRMTNYGLWVNDDGGPSMNEVAVDYIKESAEMVGLGVIYGKTTFDMTFMAEVMRRMREGMINTGIKGEISGEEIEKIFKAMHKEYEKEVEAESEGMDE